MKQGIIRKSKKEFETLQEIKNYVSSVDINFWKAAELIYEVRKRKGYKFLGYERIEDYCEDGIGKSYSAITQLLRAYEVAVIKLKIAPQTLPDHTKVYRVAEMLENDPTRRLEWLEKARLLSDSALRIEKKEYKTGIRQIDCPHLEIIKLNYCKTCGAKIRNYEK